MFAKKDAGQSARVTRKALVAGMGRLLDAKRVANVCLRGGSNPRYHLEMVEPTHRPDILSVRFAAPNGATASVRKS